MILTKIRDACLVRVEIGKKLFNQEFTNVPECMFKDGKAYHNSKSDLLQLITPMAAVVGRSEVNAQGLVVDCSTVIRSNVPFANTTTDMAYRNFAFRPN